MSAVLDCSLGSPGHGWDSCGWSLLTWHGTERFSALSGLGDGLSNASADEEASPWLGGDEGMDSTRSAAGN